LVVFLWFVLGRFFFFLGGGGLFLNENQVYKLEIMAETKHSEKYNTMPYQFMFNLQVSKYLHKGKHSKRLDFE